MLLVIRNCLQSKDMHNCRFSRGSVVFGTVEKDFKVDAECFRVNLVFECREWSGPMKIHT